MTLTGLRSSLTEETLPLIVISKQGATDISVLKFN